MSKRSEQETFWEGEFGNSYTERNKGGHWIASNTSFFANALGKASRIKSVLELGANRGLNIQALAALLPQASLSAVEINSIAATELERSCPDAEIFKTSLLEFRSEKRWDMCFTKGVLIHINPEKLSDAYQALYEHSSKYILLAEYYNPSPVEISYHGHSSKLFKRDFAGEILEKYEDLRLIDYGFVYHRDLNFPQDDLTWFLMEKQSSPTK